MISTVIATAFAQNTQKPSPVATNTSEVFSSFLGEITNNDNNPVTLTSSSDTKSSVPAQPSLSLDVKGTGYLVTNQSASNSGQFLYENGGTFTENAAGDLVNNAGLYLEGWPLNSSGQLPANSTSLSSLEPISLDNLQGVVATSSISVSMNLNAEQSIFAGTSVTATPDSSDPSNSGIEASAIIVPSGTDSIARGDSFTIATGTATKSTFTYGGFSEGRNITTGTGGDAGTLKSNCSYTGNILDADSTTQSFLTSTSNYNASALSFSITTAASGTAHFTYNNTNPDPTQGQFSNLQNLATAINDTQGLTARVVNNQLLVGATNANAAVTFADGNTTSSGIDWVGELGLANVTVGTNRFSSLNSLASDVNATAGLSASVSNPVGESSLAIDAISPLVTLDFSDSYSNKGSLLSELGITPSLNDASFTVQTTGILSASYDPSNPATSMASGAVTPQYSRPITVYDSLGEAHTLDIGFLKTGVNSWSAEVYAQPASDVTSAGAGGAIASGTITFNGNGSLKSVSSSLQNLNISWSDGADSSDIALNLGTQGQTNGLEQFASNYSVYSVTQNGAPAGTVTGVSVDAKGIVTASFSNGTKQAVYQLPLAVFAHPGKLDETKDGAFKETKASGDPVLEVPCKKDTGTLVAIKLR